MGHKTVVSRAWLPVLVFTLALPVAAFQPGRPAQGSRVAVVAIHDSRLLTLCPVIGKDVIVSDFWSGGMKAKATVGRAWEGAQKVGLHYGDSAWVILPIPAPNAAGTPSPGAAAAVRDLERLAPDPQVQRLVEQQFRKLGRYTVVESPAEADLVFLVESYYVPMAAGAVRLPPGRDVASRPTPGAKTSPERIFSETANEWARRQWDDLRPGAPDPTVGPAVVLHVIGGDQWAPNWRQASLAIAVPAEVYRQHAGDGLSLSAARSWQGLSAAGSAAVKLPPKGTKAPGTVTLRAASPEALVDQFHGKAPRLPDYLPVCAATTETIPAIGEASGSPRQEPLEKAPAPDPALGRAPQAQFRSHITLVTVPVTVAGRDGRSVDDLRASDFHVFEDGVEQKLDRVEPGTAPAQVALLIDTSLGMRPNIERIIGAAQSLVDALRPADRAAVVSFDTRVRVRAGFTANRAELQMALAQVRPAGGTRLYDAIALTVLDVLDPGEGRNAIVLFTDGVDTASRLTDDTGVLAAVDTSNVDVYVLRYLPTQGTAATLPTLRLAGQRWQVARDDEDKDAAGLDAAERFLGRLATGTGGRMYVARSDADVREVLAEISRDLSRQYVLRYYPTNNRLDGTYRQIRVTVDRPGDVVRARKGYRAGAFQAGR